MMLSLIMGGFAVIKARENYTSSIDVLNSIICIIIALILYLISFIVTLKYRYIDFINIIFTVLCMFFGIKGMELLFPIIFFQVAKNNVNIYFSILVSIVVNFFIFNGEDLTLSSLYIILINMYLFQLKEESYNFSELKEAGRYQRHESYMLQEKLKNMDKYLEQSNIVTGLKERNFIAQKLHDKLGHRITSSIMQLEVTKETMDKDNETAKKYLDSAMGNLREGMDEIRRFLRVIKPRERVINLEDIKEEIRKFQFASGINVNLHVDGDVDKIPFELLNIIKENIEEALTNAAKYSQADKIKISLYIYNKILRVEIRDNGIGFERIHKGLGLQGMEDRVYKVNGKISYDNDEGFVINMIFNLGD